MSVVPDSSTSVDPSVSSIVNPATSSSVVTTDTVWSATLLKSESDIESTIVMVMVEFWSPSMISSSAPVTVTVCGVSQFAGVKEIVPDIVASPISLEDIAITTLSLGWASRTIVNVSVVPDSSTSVEPMFNNGKLRQHHHQSLTQKQSDQQQHQSRYLSWRHQQRTVNVDDGSVNNAVIGSGNGDGLWRIPVRRRKGQMNCYLMLLLRHLN